MMDNSVLLENLTARLQQTSGLKEVRGLFGIDGYVDDLYSVVCKRKGAEKVEVFSSLEQFYDRIQTAIRKSADHEILLKDSRAGGNAILTAHCLSRLGASMQCIGLFGKSTLHPAFKQLNTDCELISLGAPAHTIAFEFSDGKLMFGELSQLHAVSWDKVTEVVPVNDLYERIAACQIIGMVNWAATLNMDSIMKHIYEEIVLKLPENILNEKIFFFDTSDIRARTEKEFRNFLAMIGLLTEKSRVVISFNENEARTAAAIIGLKADDDLVKLNRKMFEMFKTEELVFHTLDGALACNKDTQVEVPGLHVENPAISTGGGDNFNGGLCAGLLMKLPLDQQLLLANGVASYYVAKGSSGTIEEILKYMKERYQLQ